MASESNENVAAFTTEEEVQQNFNEGIRFVAEARKEEGNQLYKLKRYDEALRKYDEAIELCPESVAYYGNRCACLMMISRFNEALEDAVRCVRLDPSYVKGYVREAKCHLVLGDAKAAEQSLANIERLDPNHTDLALESENLKKLKANIAEYEKAIVKKDYRSGLFYATRSLDVATHCTRFKVMKAECLVLLGRHQEAQDVVNDIIRVEPTNADALYVRGLSLYYHDNLEKSLTLFQHALRLSPEHEKAKAIYRKAKLLKTKKEEGNAATQKNNFEDACNLYTFALQIDPLNKSVNAKLYFNRAIALTKLKKLNEAVDDCTNAVKCDENYLKAYLKRAKLYSDLEMYEECVRDYERVYQKEKTREYRSLLENAKIQLKRSQRKDYYKVLGVQKSASEDEIKKAYKKRAMMYHPDRHSDATDEVIKEHEKKFKDLGEAYNVLMDAKKRSRYDNGLDLDGGSASYEFDPNMFNVFNGATSGFTFQSNFGQTPQFGQFNQGFPFQNFPFH